jgi:hypothetical protein
LEHSFDECLAADRDAFGEVPYAHLPQDRAGDGALLAVDDHFTHFSTEATPDDLPIVVEDGLTFFIEPAAVNRVRFRIDDRRNGKPFSCGAGTPSEPSAYDKPLPRRVVRYDYTSKSAMTREGSTPVRR